MCVSVCVGRGGGRWIDDVSAVGGCTQTMHVMSHDIM